MRKWKIKLFLLLGCIIGFFFFGNWVVHSCLASEDISITEKQGPPVNEQMDLLLLVNRDHALSDSYQVSLASYDNQRVASVLLVNLKKMVVAASRDGVVVRINTAYRSKQEQQEIWDSQIHKLVIAGYSYQRARQEVQKTVMEPGYSEHQTGLAIDFSIPGQTAKNQKMWSWLAINGYQYGFILRYPADKEAITQISYEPWHFRYVGKKNAKLLWESGLCLEEYLKQGE